MDGTAPLPPSSEPERARPVSLEDRVADLVARVTALEAENHRLRESPHPADGAHLAAGAGRTIDRRRLLAGAAGVAAAGVAATVVSAQPAAANGQGQSLTLGDPNNTASATTGLSASLDTAPALGVWNSSSGQAIVATTGTETLGDMRAVIVGQSDDTIGVGGQSKNAYGVSGLSDSRAGVYGGQAGALPAPDGCGVLGQGVDNPGVIGITTSATQSAVRGRNDATVGGYGLYGSTPGGIGVYGVVGEPTNELTVCGVGGDSKDDIGVFGVSAAEGVAGVHGSNQTAGGYGVKGFGSAGVGVAGFDLGGGEGVHAESRAGTAARFVGDGVHLALAPFQGRSAPTGDSIDHTKGEVVCDDDAVLWYCVASGTPGTWRRLSGPAAAGSFHVLPTPARIYDSRPGTFPGQGPKAPLVANTARTLDLTVNNSTVPPGATAALVTILLVNAYVGNGNFTVWANGASRPLANTMVWGGNAQRFTATGVAALDPAAKVQVLASASTDLVLDVVGFYR